MFNRIEINRSDLYQKVWKQPLTKLAEEFGITDRGLAKICHRYEIPLPGIGHWNRVHAGHIIQPLPLKPMIKQEPYYMDPIYITPNFAPGIKFTVKERPLEIQKAIDFDLTPTNKIKVSFEGDLQHPISQEIKQISTTWKIQKGLLVPKGKEESVLHVSAACLPRALYILDGMLLALEARGHKVTLNKTKTITVFLLMNKSI